MWRCRNMQGVQVMTIKIEEGKPYMTKCGYRWTGYAVYSGGDYPVHGAWQHPKTLQWHIGMWSLDGKHMLNEEYDLKPAPREFARERGSNVYEWEETMHLDKWRANAAAGNADTKRLACVRVMIECREG